MADPTPPLDADVIKTIIRDEIDRNNKTLEFIQGQIDKDRTFYKHLYSFAAGVIAIVAALAVFVSYNSVSQMRADIKASVDAERDLRADIKASVDAERERAKAEINTELAKAHEEVQARVDKEFESKNIHALVADAAKEHTATELHGVIHSETQKAVDDATTTVRNRLAYFQDFVEVASLATLSKSDDRQAYDKLYALSQTATKPAIREQARVQALQIYLDTRTSFAPHFNESVTSEQMKRILTNDPSSFAAQSAIESYPEEDQTILPLLVEVIHKSNSLRVVVAAFDQFVKRTHTEQQFRFPQYAELTGWWNKNHYSTINH
jgi:hypothetical protein